jgi:hypothetical protein
VIKKNIFMAIVLMLVIACLSVYGCADYSGNAPEQSYTDDIESEYFEGGDSFSSLSSGESVDTVDRRNDQLTSQITQPIDTPNPQQVPQPNIVEGRKLIKNGYFDLKVDHFENVRNALAKKAQELGGDIFNSTVSEDDDAVYGWIIIRIPSSNFDSFVEYMRTGLGWKIESERIETKDVTDQFVDLTARIDTLENAISRLENILNRTGRLSEVLEVEEAIISRISQLESIKGQLRVLEDKIDLSTLEITLTEPKNVLIEGTDDVTAPLAYSINNFYGILKNSTEILFEAIGGFISMIAALIPWMIFLGIIAGIIISIVLYRKKKKNKSPKVEIKAES